MIVIAVRQFDPKIRLAKNSDEKGIRDFISRIRQEWGVLIAMEVDEDLYSLENHYNERGGLFLLLEIEGTLLGTFALYPVDGKVCELRKMYLDPSLRGQGIGRQMLSFLTDHARARGFETIRLDVNFKFRKANRLYRTFGFRRVKASEIECGQDYVLELRLRS